MEVVAGDVTDFDQRPFRVVIIHLFGQLAHEDGIAGFRREAGTGGRPNHPAVTLQSQADSRIYGHIALHDLAAGTRCNRCFL
jgi:hypothetical protein